MKSATKDKKNGDVEEVTKGVETSKNKTRQTKKVSSFWTAVAALLVTAIAVALVVGALKISKKKKGGNSGDAIENNNNSNNNVPSSNSDTTAGIGTDPLELCSCSPSSYEFKLNFTNTCGTEEEEQNMGVSSTSCLIDAFGSASVTDLVPVSVQTIDILELGQSMTVLSQRTIDGDDFDEKSNNLVYNSIIPDDQFQAGEVNLPSAIQFNIIGKNQFDEPLINVFIITFTNDCSIKTTLESGHQVGWITISQVEPPLKEYCPL